MICPSPILNSTRNKRETDDATKYQLGLLMDGVQEVLDLSNFNGLPESQLTIVEDPVYYDFGDKKREYKGEALVLNVRFT